jgi:hypothetical protein
LGIYNNYNIAANNNFQSKMMDVAVIAIVANAIEEITII